MQVSIATAFNLKMLKKLEIRLADMSKEGNLTGIQEEAKNSFEMINKSIQSKKKIDGE